MTGKSNSDPLATETFEQIGRLCAAWAYLETITEASIWGILGIDHSLGRLITWPKDLRDMWQLLIAEAPAKHNQQDIELLKEINKDLTAVTKDRNIVIHGVISALVDITGAKPPPYSPAPTDARITVQPAWTVSKGEHAGKRFPVSSKSVKVITSNVKILTQRLIEFNKKHGYSVSYFPNQNHEGEWPVPLKE